MNTFEEVIQSVIFTFLKDNKHSTVAADGSNLKTTFDQSGQIVTIILELSNSKEIEADFHFSDWAINACIRADNINSKIVLDFATMVEYLKTSFALVYKNVKW